MEKLKNQKMEDHIRLIYVLIVELKIVDLLKMKNQK
jgi:hypothetical protein